MTARSLGSAGNGLTISVTTNNSEANSTPLTAQTSGPALAGGIDGTCADPNGSYWRTDLAASPPINRAARDWSAAFFTALNGYGIQPTASLDRKSTRLNSS